MVPVSATRHLAQMIEQDIQRRALRPGEMYFTAEDVGRMLNVPPRTANRAMQLLATEGVLDRRRGVGTFIGARVRRSTPVQLRCVHVLITMERIRTGLVADDLLVGLSQELRGDVQFNQLPDDRPLEYVRRVIEAGADGGNMVGLVLVGCPRDVQEYVAEAGVPAVVFGSVYPGSSQLPSIDIDHYAAGRLMARHLLERGHRRLVLLMREKWLQGDNRLLDGITSELAERDMRQGALIVRSVPPDHAAASHEVRRLTADEQQATGWMIRGRTLTQAALDVWRNMGVELKRDVELVSETDGAISDATPGHSMIVPQMNYRERATEAGRLLLERDRSQSVRHVAIGLVLRTQP